VLAISTDYNVDLLNKPVFVVPRLLFATSLFKKGMKWHKIAFKITDTLQQAA
jgi:hypothetical protein